MVKTKLTPPAKAFQFAAEVQIGKPAAELSTGLADTAKKEGSELAAGDGTEEPPPKEPPTEEKPQEKPTALAAGNVPVQIVARTGGVADQLFWGRCVHDFAGMSAPPVIPLDYMHDPREVVGIGESIDAGNGVLNIAGQLIPFHDKDRASEIIHRSQNKTPYQASILMGWNDYVSEDLPAGQSTEVNGQTVTGPVVIFRKWSLRGVAICPYGADAGTSIGLSNDAAAAEETEETPAPAADETADETVEEDAASEETPVKEENGKFSAPGAAGTTPAAVAPGAAFLAEFGDAGGVLFAKGLTIDQARVEFATNLKAQNAQLQASLAAAQGQLNAGTAPVTFQAAPIVGTNPANTAQSLTPNLAKFAAGIKFKG